MCLQEIADKYPPWLEKQAAAEGSSRLSAADLERYRRQYDCITRLCAAYESQPSNTSNIMALLQEVSESAHGRWLWWWWRWWWYGGSADGIKRGGSWRQHLQLAGSMCSDGCAC